MSSENVPRPSGTWAMPRRATPSGPTRWSERPANRMLPERRTVPETARSVVVLPAPFGPSTATTDPSSTASEIPCSTWTGP